MKNIALCVAGLAAGVGVAAVTQYPVLETLGYLPEDSSVASAEPADEMENSIPSVVAHSDAESVSKASADALKKETVSATAAMEKKPEPKTEVNDKATGKMVARDVMESERSKLAVKDVAKSSKKAAKSNKKAIESFVPSKPMKTVASVPVAKSKEHAGDRVPSIKKPVVTDKSVAVRPKPRSLPKPEPSPRPKREKVVVAKPPMKDVTPQAPATVSAPPLVGKWEVVEATYNGKEVTTDKLSQMSLEFEDDNLVIRQGKKAERGLATTGEKRRLGKLTVSDILIRSARDNKKSIKGFYFFQGKELNMVWSAPGEEAPKSMKAADLTSSRVFKLKQ